MRRARPVEGLDERRGRQRLRPLQQRQRQQRLLQTERLLEPVVRQGKLATAALLASATRRRRNRRLLRLPPPQLLQVGAAGRQCPPLTS